jgi:MFS family permease
MKKNKNYYLGVFHGIFYFAATGLVDYATILPTFLKYLINSNAMIGFVAAIARGGTILFQLVSAAYLEGKKKKPILVFALWVRFLSWVLIALSSYILLPEHKITELTLFVIFISAFSFAGGVSVIPFYDIITHNIPSHRLGKFWATRQFVGGIIAVGSGYVVKVVMRDVSYPNNYTILFSLASLVFGLGFLSLGLMDEGEVSQKKNASFGEFLSSAVNVLRVNRDFSSMVFSEFLSHSIFMCMPFIAIYTTYTLGLNKSDIGYFISAQMAGSIVSNLFWGYFSDRKGPKFIIISTNILALSVPFLSIFIKSFYMFVVVFFLLGSYMHGSFIGYTNYMLKIAPENKRPTFVSIRGTFNSLSYFLPTIGGFIVDKVSYHSLFIVTSIMSLAGLIYAVRLKTD